MSLAPTVRVVLRNALPALSLAMVCMTASAPAQSLGDVARQEQARRKSTSSGKVYTNDDLRSSPAPATTTPSSSGGTVTGDAKSSATADAKDGTKSDSTPAVDGKGADGKSTDAAGDKAKSKEAEDEAAWRKRQKTIQESLDRARTFADALQSRINGLTAEFAAKDDPAQRSLVATERQKALTELDRVKKEIQQHTQALDDLREEARKSGVPPGWLR